MADLILPWPHKALLSNARVHWRQKATATKAARSDAFYAAKAARLERDPEARLIVQFLPPDLRHRDLHNMMQAIKPAIDGIADAMGCDDRGFRIRWPEEFGPPIRHGRVLIEIRKRSDGLPVGGCGYADLHRQIVGNEATADGGDTPADGLTKTNVRSNGMALMQPITGKAGEQ